MDGAEASSANHALAARWRAVAQAASHQLPPPAMFMSAQ